MGVLADHRTTTNHHYNIAREEWLQKSNNGLEGRTDSWERRQRDWEDSYGKRYFDCRGIKEKNR